MQIKPFIIILLLNFSMFRGIAQERDLKAEYEAFRNQARKEYNDFRDKANAEYADFMRRAWQWYQASPAIPAPKVPDQPKPPVTIPDDEIEKIPENRPVPYSEVIPAPVVIEQPKPVAPVPEAPQPDESRFNFTVFGTACNVRLSDQNRFSLKDCDENTIAELWQRLSRSEYNNLIRDCLELRIRLNLCDWAYLEMLQQLAGSFFGKDSNEAALLTAFLYSQSGYKMRLARSETNRLYLLVASRHLIYSMGYFNLGDDNLYPLNCKEYYGLYICNITFPGEQDLSLDIGKEQRFATEATAPRELISRRYPNLQVTLSSNKNLMDFFNTYPQSQINNDGTTKWQFYANTPLSRQVQETLYPALKEDIKGKSEQNAANMLINFVQTAFEYKEDEKVWGDDRPFFADETIYYPFSDCEDRAILFSRLVRDLMGLKVVLVYYPGHLATAVQFNEDISGDYLLVHDARYLICDPTYIGATIGKTMPGMDNDKATVVFLEQAAPDNS